MDRACALAWPRRPETGGPIPPPRGGRAAGQEEPRQDAACPRRCRHPDRTTGKTVTARLIDGTSVAATLRAAIARRVAAAGFSPGLAVVLVGDDPASAIYVRTKDRAAREAAIEASTIRLPGDTTQVKLLETIDRLNADPAIDGILVQLPLPRGIDQQAVIEAIDPAKDVDGFHPINVGHLADGQPTLVPCPPLAATKLL